MSLEYRPHDLYRFYDVDDELLYVGISLSAAHRASQHRTEKPWWNDVAWMQVQHLGNVSRHTAEAIERDAIQYEKPIHNITHSNRPLMPPPLPRRHLSETGHATYEAILSLMSGMNSPSPWTREDIINAVRDGVKEAIADNVDLFADVMREQQ